MTKLQTCAGAKVWQRAILCCSFPCQALHITTYCIPAKQQNFSELPMPKISSSPHLTVTFQPEHVNATPIFIGYSRQQTDDLLSTTLLGILGLWWSQLQFLKHYCLCNTSRFNKYAISCNSLYQCHCNVVCTDLSAKWPTPLLSTVTWQLCDLRQIETQLHCHVCIMQEYIPLLCHLYVHELRDIRTTTQSCQTPTRQHSK